MTDAAMPMETESLPPLYERWMATLLPGGIPRERVATCLDCAMCAKTPEDAASGSGFFNPTTKCCTYFPAVPNFLVGRAMDVDTPGGAVLRGFVEADSTKEAIVTLRGVMASTKHSILYSSMGMGSGFGQEEALLCPYAIDRDTPEGPLCGIWQHRNAVCSTYFCKHVRGGTGRHFWMSIRNLISHVELALSWWAVAELIPELPAVLLQPPSCEADSIDSEMPPDAWKHWPGTKADFYRACSERVEALLWDEILVIAGIKSQIQAREMLANYARLRSADIPEKLQTAAYSTVRSNRARTALHAGARSEQFEVPTRLVSLLGYFDGRPVAAVIADIQEQEHVELEVGLVRKLYDFGILEQA